MGDEEVQAEGGPAGEDGPAAERVEPPPLTTPAVVGTRTRDEGAPGHRIPARIRWAILAVLAAVFLATGLHQAARDAPTVDEGVDVSSGVTSLVKHDLRMSPEHAALPKVVAALPSLIARPIVPETEAYRSGAWFDYSEDFVAANEQAGRLDEVLFWNRTVALAEGLSCAVLLYFLAKRWFGPDGGLLAAGAWLTTPFVVGMSHVAMIDVPFTLATLAVVLALARWRERPETGRTVVLGLALGLALVTRHTALVLVAVAVVVVARQLWADARQAVQTLGVLGLLSFGCIWVVYRAIAWSTPRSVAAAGIGPEGAGAKLVDALPLPWEWRAGFSYLDVTSNARPSSLLGQSWMGGKWWYFPVSAFLKLPLPLVVAIVVGWALAVRPKRTGRPGGNPDRLGLLATVALPAAALWAFLLVQPLNLGLRLALPTVALAYVGLGAIAPAAASAFARRETARRATATAMPVPMRARGASTPVRVGVGIGCGVVVLTQVVVTVAAGSHSIAYTPPPWRPSYRWVSDANIDAGQALYELRDWAEDHRGAFVAYDRTRGLEVEGGSRPLKGVRPASVRGWVAVGVTPLMQTRREELLWLHKYCPVDSIASGAVLIYRFTEPPDPAPGPETPARPCTGAASSH